ncbi:LrgA family protein [Evansella cellulosilytica DSM 2522]|uniref:LrgA family protein n=1 Tax=Evansella cellulosilytica (strain ATCC 21833 / DSM 2522 / FERM P-1141 / JCM 9156 / N-4) TaxID=649639 RepID=E6TQM5_EVAC2|nr:CidA/LrgA family protein [Evansella cellulosilytica]ADU30536.1 LrgA family protein [Evansella cellulosilytica DSM 2522]
MFRIIVHIGILYSFFWLGSFIQHTFQLRIPGSIIGMLLLFLLFTTKVIKPQWLEDGASLLLRNMPLLFLPVTVGILNYLGFFAGRGFLLIFIALISTFLVMVISGIMTQLLVRKMEKVEKEYE